MTPTPESIFLEQTSLAKKLDRARDELLDLSARNRLLNMPRSSRAARSIEVTDEKPVEVYRLLVREGKSFTFLAGRAQSDVQAEPDADEVEQLAQPEDDSRDERGVLNRHADTKLQTRLTPAGLQKRLLDMYTDARTLEDEQGVNILYLALGTLRWIDSSDKTLVRHAPLLLVPVLLERASARERFRLKWRQEDCTSNISLEAFLDRIHLLKLPSLDFNDDFDYTAYANGVADVISTKEGWSVQTDDIVLGFFSYAKFLMYRDLDIAAWPKALPLTEAGLIRPLLEDGFPQQGKEIRDDSDLDRIISPEQMRHVHDSDSSQVMAAHYARAGHSLVIQGPPGTGKSQTIANIIGEAIIDGKRVLFVSEKMAALEVVKRRLDQAGVGDACLELHSNKANKRVLLEELRRTWELGPPKGPEANVADAALESSRALLNHHVSRMHANIPGNGLTPYEVIGRLSQIARHTQNTSDGTDIQIEGAAQWNAGDRRMRIQLLRELSEWISEEGMPSDHAWWGTGLDSILPADAARFSRKAQELALKLNKLQAELTTFTDDLEISVPQTFREIQGLKDKAHRVTTAPESTAACLAAEEWSRTEEIASLVASGERFAALGRQLQGTISPRGWYTDISAALPILQSLAEGVTCNWLKRVARIIQLAPQLIAAARATREALRLAGDDQTIGAIRKTITTARLVAAAPPAAPDTFRSAVWDHGVQKAGDLVRAVEILESSREETRDRMADTAWDTDCGFLRNALAAHGAGAFRWLNSDWRRASRSIKTLLRNSRAPLSETLDLLDHVIRGQKARAEINAGDSFGSAAFGDQWRGERSSGASLRRMWEWAEVLGPRSHEIRELTASIQDLPAVRVHISCFDAIWMEFEPLLSEVGTGLPQPQSIADDSDLLRLKEQLEALVAAEATCSDVFTVPPDLISEQVQVMGSLIQWRERQRVLTNEDALGGACFGKMWRGASSEWNVLKSAAAWVAANGDIRSVATRFMPPAEAGNIADRINGAENEIVPECEQLFGELRFNYGGVLQAADVRDLNIERLGGRLKRWAAAREDLSKWVLYTARSRQARDSGLGEFLQRLESGQLAPQDAASQFECACYYAAMRSLASEDPELARFDGRTHQNQIDEFVRLEAEHKIAARIAATRVHYEKIPHGGAGPVGVLKAEIARKRGHMPIRQLMAHAGPAVQALKPVFMMSPLSVAQFLPPGEVHFDLLVMDEASQIQPVDALGAVARCRQAVVVGDEQQLPPTRFFSRMTGTQSDDDENEAAQVADLESILGLFLARGVAKRTLLWHYRSEHQSLIAVSNWKFYEDKLCVLPSPYTAQSGRGLRFHYVSDGIYDSGNTRTNIVEARQIAAAVMQHARQHPDKSLGVGTFSIAQRRAILDQIELLRRADTAGEGFFSTQAREPFFVKNLENIQGDERDIIFISVGYAKTADGRMSMNFGPLSSQGGERRLNVLITRARQRCEVFSSITYADIDLDRVSSKGVATFELFLRYAQTGVLGSSRTTLPEESAVALEEDVADALRSRGFEVDTHVGVSGAFVDVAVLDSDHRGRYIIGIECDGRSYAGAKSARDRDRLRGDALRRQGWRLHRVWGMDWYQRPDEQLARIIAVIDRERQRLKVEADDVAERVSETAIERDEPTQSPVLNSENACAYSEASPKIAPSGLELLDTPISALAEIVFEIVDIEGPIHQDEVVVRIRNAWGLHRAGIRIQEHVSKAIRAARISKSLAREGKFLCIAGKPVKLRDRSRVTSKSLRWPEMLPPGEIRTGVTDIVRENFGARQDEIVNTVLRRLGYAASSVNLREVVENVVDKMVASGSLAQHGELLVLTESSAAVSARNPG